MITGRQAAAVALIMIIAIPTLAGYAFASETHTKTVSTVEDTISFSDQLLNGETYYYDTYDSPNNNYLLYNGSTFYSPSFVTAGTNTSSIPVGAPSSTAFAITDGSYTSLSTFTYSNYSFASPDVSQNVRLTFGDGTTTTLSFEVGVTCFKAGGFVLIYPSGLPEEAQTYEFVSDVSVKIAGYDSLTLYYNQPTANLRAEPAYGWKNPNGYVWFNGYSNSSVTFYLHMDTPTESDTTVSFAPFSGPYNLDVSTINFTKTTAGYMRITPTYTSDTYTLGTYSDVQIIYDLYNKKVTVGGISAFPAMGTSPNIFASVEFKTSDTLYYSNELFEFIAISADDDAIWRCDSASIIAGTFAATVDCTINLLQLFPSKDVRLNLNSIGIYGDSVTIAGTTYDVDNGAITVNGETVRLKGAAIKIVTKLMDGYYFITSINDTVVNARPVSAGQPTITFDGVWGLTSTVDILGRETVNVDEWVPGAFAFDKDGFILMIIFTAVAVFVALGFTAGRSGGKVLLLAIACGGAAVIALILA